MCINTREPLHPTPQIMHHSNNVNVSLSVSSCVIYPLTLERTSAIKALFWHFYLLLIFLLIYSLHICAGECYHVVYSMFTQI